MSIKWKLLIVFLVFALLPSAVMLSFGPKIASNIIEKNALANVMHVANATEGHLLTYLDYLKARILDFSSDGFIRDQTELIVSGINIQENTSKLNKHLLENKLPIVPEFLHVIVIDLNGIIIASSNPQEIGLDESDDIYFIEGMKAPYLSDVVLHAYALQHLGDPATLSVSAPLTSKDSGKLIGVIASHVSLKTLQQILSGERQLALGALSSMLGKLEGSEIYLVNKDKLALTDLFYVQDAVFKQAINTELVNACLNEKKELSKAYVNYVGETVYGASTCLPVHGWTLIVEQSQGQALAPLIDAVRVIGFLALILAIVSLIFGLGFSLTITQPVQGLAEFAEKLKQRNFKARAKVKTGDELELLADVMNSMAAELGQSFRVLELKVKARTKELELEKNKLAKTFEFLEELLAFSPSMGPILFKVGKEFSKKNFKNICAHKKLSLTQVRKQKNLINCLKTDLTKLFRERGLGKLKLSSYNLKKKEFVFRLAHEIPHPKESKHKDYLELGLIAGFIEAITSRETGGIESKCISMGDSYCEFKVWPLKR